MVSMKEIANKCGVSVATVSKALNDQPDIGTATKELIQRTADELGYTANLAARSLRTNRTYNIGVLYDTDMAHEYFSQVLESFRKETEDAGYDITFINKNYGGKPSSFRKHCEYRKVDGVAIITTEDFTSPEIEELAGSGIPLVAIDYRFEGCSSVISDNSKGLEELVHYAYEMGHRKIAYIHGELTEVTRQRIAGFRRACKALNLDIPDDYIFEGRYHDIESCRRETEKILKLKELPSCIIFQDDYSYLGGMSVLTEAGYAIPEDISVMAYDGISMAKVLGITTYEQDTEYLGQQAAKLLVRKIENPKGKNRNLISTGKLFKGNTVKKLD